MLKSLFIAFWMIAPYAQAADSEITALKKVVAIQQAQISTLTQTALRDPLPLGQSNLPVDFSAEVGPSWTLLQYGRGQTHNPALENYRLHDRSLKARVCLMWTDNCTAGSASIRMINDAGQGVNTAENANTIYRSGEAFPLTWSGSTLWHTACGEWAPAASLLRCSPGWGGTCQLQIRRSEQVCSMTVKEAHIDWMASYP